MKYLDAHIHLYEYSEREIKRILRETDVICVAEDISTSLETIRLSLMYENVIPAVGIHPWNIEKTSKEQIGKIKKIVEEHNITILGEVGLDKQFVPNTFEKQLEFFKEFVKLAKEYDLALNLHTPRTWKETYGILIKNDISKAYFHWYAGPLNLAEEIIESGYLIGINVATLFKPEKYEKYLHLPLKGILIESDGPYRYKDKELDPKYFPDLIRKIANVKNEKESSIMKKLRENASKLIS